MSGWEKVIAATVLAVIGLAGMNLAIWRRLRAARRQQRDPVTLVREVSGSAPLDPASP